VRDTSTKFDPDIPSGPFFPVRKRVIGNEPSNANPQGRYSGTAEEKPRLPDWVVPVVPFYSGQFILLCRFVTNDLHLSFSRSGPSAIVIDQDTFYTQSHSLTWYKFQLGFLSAACFCNYDINCTFGFVNLGFSILRQVLSQLRRCQCHKTN